MHQPEIHLDVTRARHGDLLRLARTGELAARLAAARREERRSFLTRLRGERAELSAHTAR
jgi:antitoxin (DNA-binding transcriptional repressor) of toxin-antitoxin stability system